MKQTIGLALLALSLAACEPRPPTPRYLPRTPAGERARSFLCEFSGGAEGQRPSSLAGRRYSPDERRLARDRLTHALARIGLTAVEQHYVWDFTERGTALAYDRGNDEGSGTNLYAEIPATEASNRWIVVGAHYDTVAEGPGADDDGSGVTAALIVAKALVALPDRSANVMVVFFDQEEEGTIGSHAFVRTMRAQGRRITAAHCIDMVGWDGNRNRAIEIGHATGERAPGESPFRELYANAMTKVGKHQRSGALHQDVAMIRHTGMDRSDHESFLQAGIPAVLVSEEFAGNDTSPDYHKRGDTCDRIDYEYLVTAAALVAEATKEQLR